jgi:hypothetical protein
LGLTAVMAGAAWGAGALVAPLADSLAGAASGSVSGLVASKIALGIVFAVKIVVGAGVYIGGAALLRLSAFGEFVEILKKVIDKTR